MVSIWIGVSIEVWIIQKADSVDFIVPTIEFNHSIRAEITNPVTGIDYDVETHGTVGNKGFSPLRLIVPSESISLKNICHTSPSQSQWR